MDLAQLERILNEYGKKDEWILEHLTNTGNWRSIIYNIGQEKLLSEIDKTNIQYLNYKEDKGGKEDDPDRSQDLRKEFIKEEWLKPQIKDYFYKRKRDLDQVVYSMLRLSDIGLAEELYLRLKNGESSISELAHKYSLGPEKYTKGIVGPMPLSKANEQIRAISNKENIGKLNKPIVVQNTIIISIVEHIIEATLTPEMEQKLLEELFNIELQKIVNVITGSQ